MRKPKLSDDEKAIIHAAYLDGTWNPVQAAAALLPNRTPAAIQLFASRRGWAAERAARRKQQRAATAATPNRVLPSPRPLPPRIGPCDRGDREIVRRRLVHAIGALSGELRRSSSAVADCVRAVVQGDFEEQPTTTTLSELLVPISKRTIPSPAPSRQQRPPQV